MKDSTSKNSRVTVAATALALAAGSLSFGAQAAPTTFFGVDVTAGAGNLAAQPNSDAARNAFFSNLAGVGTETFESETLGAIAPLPIVFIGAGTATITGTGSIVGGAPTATNQYGIGNSKYWNASTGSFRINFSEAISAFGFYGIDIESEILLDFTKSDGSILTVNPGATNNSSGSIFYFGLFDTTDTFTSVLFKNVIGSSDILAFDNMSIGSRTQVTPVSEPGALALAGLALAGLGLSRRSRKA